MIEVTVQFNNNKVRDVRLPKDCGVYVFDYDQSKYSKELLQPDENGISCRQTLWRGSSQQPVHIFTIIVKHNKISKIKLPKNGVVTIVTEDRTFQVKGKDK